MRGGISAKLALLALALLGFAAQSVGGRGRGGRGEQTNDKDFRNNYKPKFRSTPKNITVGPGDRAVLKCRVENLGTKTVTWRRKDDKHPLTIGLFPFVSDTRVTVDYNQRTNEWSLIIQDVRPTDEGEYMCVISTKKNEANTYTIKLNVKILPSHSSVPAVQVTGLEYVEKGENVHLICNATGKPDPPHDVKWYKNGNPINSDADSGILITKKIETKVLISVLVIKQSKLSDGGDYVCRSSNRDSGSIQVHILNVAATNVKRGTSEKLSSSGGLRTAGCRRDNTQALSLISLLVTLPFTRWLLLT